MRSRSRKYLPRKPRPSRLDTPRSLYIFVSVKSEQLALMQITGTYSVKRLSTWLRTHLAVEPPHDLPLPLEMKTIHYVDKRLAVIGRMARRTIMV